MTMRLKSKLNMTFKLSLRITIWAKVIKYTATGNMYVTLKLKEQARIQDARPHLFTWYTGGFASR